MIIEKTSDILITTLNLFKIQFISFLLFMTKIVNKSHFFVLEFKKLYPTAIIIASTFLILINKHKG